MDATMFQLYDQYSRVQSMSDFDQPMSKFAFFFLTNDHKIDFNEILSP